MTTFYAKWETRKIALLPEIDIYRPAGSLAVYLSWICMTVGFTYIKP